MKHIMIQDIKYQRGFTLIELMISLVLGLLISAAIIQVFITSQRVDRVQSAGSEIQDSAVFGIQSIEQQLRLANLGNDGVPINDETAKGGIVLTASEFDDDEDDDDDDDSTLSGSTNVIVKDGLKTGFLTRSGDMDSSGNNGSKWNGELTNTNIKSDQLTIQYTNTTGQILYDCEGGEIKKNERVITRYFLTEDNIKTKKDRKNLNLNCDAGRIKNNKVKNFGGKNTGEIIIKNVDQFNIRLGVKHSADNSGSIGSYKYTEMSVKDYMNLTEKPFITNVKIALLTRSSSNSPDDSASAFNIFGTTQTLKPETNAPKYLRRVYETNTLLRNARIVNVINSGS